MTQQNTKDDGVFPSAPVLANLVFNMRPSAVVLAKLVLDMHSNPTPSGERMNAALWIAQNIVDDAMKDGIDAPNIEREKRKAVPTLPDYTSSNSYEVWYWDNKTWQFRGSCQKRDNALNLAESCGHPFWAIILCSRSVAVNTVED